LLAPDLPDLVQESEMTSVTWALLIIAIVAIAFGVVMAFKTRSKKLRSKFGPEYERLVRERGSTFKAERELEQREKRVEKFQIRPLSVQESDQFAREWRATQEKFVDNPVAAFNDAGALVDRALKARGYPTGENFEARVADLSVDHPRVVEHYRMGHDIAVRNARNPVSTEDLRIAMRHYHALFDDLLSLHTGETTGTKFTGVRR
jgi:hypothetical protein